MIGWKRLVVTALCLASWRALEQITVVGVNPSQSGLLLQSAGATSLIGAIGRGVPLASLSIVAIGLSPYIAALIIVTLLVVISERVRSIANHAGGPLRLRRWTRALTVLLALGQAYGWTVLMQNGSALPSPMDWFPRLVVVLELVGGTMILLLLGDVLDDFGLGFGNGAILIYALSPLAVEVHRLAFIFSSAPSVEALYLPFGVWLAFSIGVVTIAVAVRIAIRRFPAPELKKKVSKPVDLKLLLSGVLRPPLFAHAVMFLPVIYANWVSVSNPSAFRWITDSWTPYGPNSWTNIAYVAVDVGLVIGFTYFVVACDFGSRLPQSLTAHINRLTFICGTFLALTTVVFPVLEWDASRAAGSAIPMSGTDAVLIVVLILAIVGSLEQSTRRGRRIPVQVSRLP